jgi:hypothetical protein
VTIGQAAAIAAELRIAHVPPLALIEKDIDRVERELGSLLERAKEVAKELEEVLSIDDGPAQARRLIAGARLNEIRQLLSLAHCALIPHEDPRKAASRRTAEYVRKKSPPLVLLHRHQGRAA